ncbi:MAG: type II toxin-antitoxin system HicA family toxin [Armatimonadetes bacterium]|nr:type II toxin-antitoxin system HicA family toxin [Armatimonadota bacterium]
MSGRVRRMSAAQVEALLKRYGFELISQRGRHRKWRHAVRRLQVIVPEHRGRQLPLGTLHNIFLHAEIPTSEWMK